MTNWWAGVANDTTQAFGSFKHTGVHAVQIIVMDGTNVNIESQNAGRGVWPPIAPLFSDMP